MVLKHKRPLKQQSQNIKNTNFNSIIDTEIPLKVRLFLSPQIVNIKHKRASLHSIHYPSQNLHNQDEKQSR